MKIINFLSTVVVGMGLLMISSCSDDNGMMSENSDLVMSTSPAPGEPAYDPSGVISVKFGSAVDTLGFHNRLFCVDALVHESMHDSLDQGMMGDRSMMPHDSMNQYPGAGMMDQMMGGRGDMGDLSEFYRRMHDRRVPGEFMWNASRDSCAFVPDTPLMGNHDYILMLTSMQSAMGPGHEQGMTEDNRGDLMISFHTR